jgi:hypothetical protein
MPPEAGQKRYVYDFPPLLSRVGFQRFLVAGDSKKSRLLYRCNYDYVISRIRAQYVMAAILARRGESRSVDGPEWHPPLAVALRVPAWCATPFVLGFQNRTRPLLE